MSPYHPFTTNSPNSLPKLTADKKIILQRNTLAMRSSLVRSIVTVHSFWKQTILEFIAHSAQVLWSSVEITSPTVWPELTATDQPFYSLIPNRSIVRTVYTILEILSKKNFFVVSSEYSCFNLFLSFLFWHFVIPD